MAEWKREFYVVCIFCNLWFVTVAMLYIKGTILEGNYFMLYDTFVSGKDFILHHALISHLIFVSFEKHLLSYIS